MSEVINIFYLVGLVVGIIYALIVDDLIISLSMILITLILILVGLLINKDANCVNQEMEGKNG